MDNNDGIWRTVGGRRIFIKDGQSLEEAMRESGKFSLKENVDEFGVAYREYTGKPNEAIDKLLAEKKGYVPSAIYKEDIGDIDFVWGKKGKDGYGLAHIIERREQYGINGENFVRGIPDLIENGEVMKNKYGDRIYIAHKNETAVIRLDFDGKKSTWLVTAYVKE